MKKVTCLLSILLFLLFLVSCSSGFSDVDEWPSAAETRASGECGAEGDNIRWALRKKGTLILEGTGEMEEYPYEEAPWFPYIEKIRRVYIGDGITEISAKAFRGLEKMETVRFPDSLTSIGFSAFSGCAALREVSFPPRVTVWDGAFSGCESLKELRLPGGGDFCPSVFADCSGLEKVICEEGVDGLSAMLFCSCGTIPEIYLPSTLDDWSIGNGVFIDTHIGTVYFAGSAEDVNDIFHISDVLEKADNVVYDHKVP